MDGVKERLSSLYSQSKHDSKPSHRNSKSQGLLQSTKSLKSLRHEGTVIRDDNKDSLVPVPPSNEANNASSATILKKTLTSPLLARRKVHPQDITRYDSQLSFEATMEKNTPRIPNKNSPVLLLPSNLKRNVRTYDVTLGTRANNEAI